MKRFLLIICLMLPLLPAAAQTSSQKSRKAMLEKEIAILDRQIKENGQKSNKAESSLKLTRKKISTRKQLVAESEKEIKLLDAQISAKEDTIARLQARLDTLSADYDRLVRTAYRSRDSRVWYMYVLAARDLGQGLRRYGYLKSLSSQMRTQASRIKETQNVLMAEKDAAEKLRKEAAKVKQGRLAELDKLQKEEGDSKKLVDRLKKDNKTYQQQLTAKKKEVAALNRQMQKMVEKATEKSPGGSKTAIDTKLDAEFAQNQGKLPWPADGPVVDSFGEHYHPVYKKIKMPFNNGINITLGPDTAVKSVFDGKVCQVIIMPGYNECVLVQHGGYFTFYCKLANVSVKAGDNVKTGQVLGLVDTISGETELHFELWEGKTPQNPEIWLR